MAIYVVTGKLGTGKSKYAVGKIRAALNSGRKVATNLDLHLEHLVPGKRKSRVYRLPDKPTVRDLEAIGHGNPDSYDEDRNGLLVLDELGSWLNSRQFMDKERQPVIDWLIHARKHGWDVVFIAQAIQQIDKQVRESLAEYVVTCYRLDKFKIPVLGQFLSMFHDKAGNLPRFHIAATKINLGGNQWHTLERDFYRGDDLHKAYDTRQVFAVDPEAATFTNLHPHYFTAPPAARRSLLAQLVHAIIAPGRKPAKPAPRCPGIQPDILSLLRRLPPDLRVVEFQRLQRLGHV